MCTHPRIELKPRPGDADKYQLSEGKEIARIKFLGINPLNAFSHASLNFSNTFFEAL